VRVPGGQVVASGQLQVVNGAADTRYVRDKGGWAGGWVVGGPRERGGGVARGRLKGDRVSAGLLRA
jgi:hypothetical protein